jgi:hypothetical protein
MKKTVIEFVINQSGGIQSTIKEIKGDGCEKIVDSLKLGLGEITATKRTSEYYQRTSGVICTNSVKKWE